MVAEKRRPDTLELRKVPQEYMYSTADGWGNNKINETSRAHKYEDSKHNQADGLIQNPRMYLPSPMEQKLNKPTLGLLRINRTNEVETRTRSGNRSLRFLPEERVVLKTFLNQLDLGADMAFSLFCVWFILALLLLSCKII